MCGPACRAYFLPGWHSVSSARASAVRCLRHAGLWTERVPLRPQGQKFIITKMLVVRGELGKVHGLGSVESHYTVGSNPSTNSEFLGKTGSFWAKRVFF